MNGVIPKHGMQLDLSSNESNFTVNFEEPLVLDDDVEYAIGLVNLETYYNFPNIEYGKNNTFYYSADKGTTYNVVNIDTGSYSIGSLSSAIFEKMRANNHFDTTKHKPHIQFHYDKNIGKVMLTIKDGYTIDFNRPKTFRDLLGFGANIYTVNSSSSEPAKILHIKSIMIHVDVVEGSFVNGAKQPIIYTFTPNVSSKFMIKETPKNLIYTFSSNISTILKFTETPKNIIYVKINKKYIPYFNVKITDQDGKLLNFGGENIRMRLHIRSQC